MKVGDLVDVHEQRGAGTLNRYIVEKGLGIITEVIESTPLYFNKTVGSVELGPTFVVRLSTGAIERFCESDLRIVSERRKDVV